MTTEDPPPRGWASDKDLATHYRVDRTTIWRWVRLGKLPKPTQLGANTTRWRWVEVMRWL